MRQHQRTPVTTEPVGHTFTQWDSVDPVDRGAMGQCVQWDEWHSGSVNDGPVGQRCGKRDSVTPPAQAKNESTYLCEMFKNDLS